MAVLPILWSFRRCPYAMRARLAVAASGLHVELREILLRDKPAPFLAASVKGTVPVLQDGDAVIDESYDIMLWALGHRDPQQLLAMPSEGFDLIAQCDGPFKLALDHTKYAVRFPDLDKAQERRKALVFLRELDARLAVSPYLMGDQRRLADVAIQPFVRQFAHIDRAWFDQQGLPSLTVWLDEFLASAQFAAVMSKYTPWQLGQDPVLFGCTTE